MSCPCPRCNGLDETRLFFGNSSLESNEVEPEEPKSVWERLSKVSDELDKYGVPAHFINELNDLCDTIDSIDDDVTRLQKDCIKRHIDFTQFKLGEISKKLY